MSEAIAKHVIVCNHCNAEIGKHYPEGHHNISVALLSEPSENGGTYKQEHHFCNEACLGGFLTHKSSDKNIPINSPTTASASITPLSAEAKAITQCDNCKANLTKDDGDGKQHIQASLENGKKESQQYHYCDEECLRQHLNGRAKRKRERSNASLDAYGSLTLDATEFSSVTAWLAKQKK